MSQSLVRLRSVAESADDIARAWLEYGREYAKYPSLWDASLAFVSGPLRPEGAILKDYSGKTGGATWSVGTGDTPKYTQGSVRGGSFWAGQYDGIDDYSIVTSSQLDPLTSNFTVSCFANVSSGVLAAKRNVDLLGDANNNGWLLYLSSGKLRFLIADSILGQFFATSTTTIANSLSHCIGMRTGAAVSVHVNAVNEQTTPASSGSFSSTRPLAIGANNGALSPSTGLIAALGIWRRTLSSDEISTLATHPLAAYQTVRPKYFSIPWTAPTTKSRAIIHRKKRAEVGTDASSDIVRAWKEYGKDYAVHKSLWDGSLAFASGPLEPEGNTLHDYSERTSGAVWSVGVGDVPKYVQGSVRGQSFWAEQYDGIDDTALVADASFGSFGNGSANQPFSVSVWFAATLAATTIKYLIGKMDGGANQEWLLGMQGVGGAARLALWDASVGTTSRRSRISSDITALSQTWINLTATFDGRTSANPELGIDLWANGRLDNAGVNNGGGSFTAMETTSSNLVLGSLSNAVFTSQQIGTSILFRRVLTPSEIAILATHPLAAFQTVRPKYINIPWTAPATQSRAIIHRKKKAEVGTDASSDIVRAWKEYGKDYAVHKSLWDGSLAFASGPLEPEGGTLHDYSERTSGAVWSVGAGDTPKYVQGCVRGVPFVAGQYDGSNDAAITSVSLAGATQATLAAWVRPASFSVTATVVGETTEDDGGYARVMLFLGIGGNVIGRIRDAAAGPTGSVTSVDGATATRLNTWNHVALTFDSVADVHCVFLNGKLDGESTAALGALGNVAGYGNWIGRLPQRLGTPNPYTGAIASVAQYRRAITPSEIAILATHPLAAFEVRVPKYISIPWSTTATKARSGAVRYVTQISCR